MRMKEKFTTKTRRHKVRTERNMFGFHLAFLCVFVPQGSVSAENGIHLLPLWLNEFGSKNA